MKKVNKDLHTSPIDASDAVIVEKQVIDMEKLLETLTDDELDHIILDLIGSRKISPYEVILLTNTGEYNDRAIFKIAYKEDEDNIVGIKVVTDLDEYILYLYEKYEDLTYNEE